MKTIEKAYGKINLVLDVVAARADGFHDLEMIMETVALYDTVCIEVLDGTPGVHLTTNRKFLPTDRRNNATQAAELFFAALGRPLPKLVISIEKRIPVSAGMAGGSANAAAVLRGLNRLYDAPFSLAQLCAIGLEIGTDVPYCLQGQTRRASGRGEILERTDPLPDCYIVLAKPPFSNRTPQMFGRLARLEKQHKADVGGMLRALASAEVKEVAARLYNVFEDVLGGREEEIFRIKMSLLDHGAVGALMTGTGSTAYGLFTHEEKAKRAYEALAGQYEEVYCTKNFREALI